MRNLLAKCLICKAATDVMACQKCETTMRRQLSDIPKYSLLASQRLEPRPGGSGRGSDIGFGLSMSALEASCGFHAISVLELWCRDWRETYGLVQYGVATENVGQADLLADICRFLNQWLNRACRDHLGIDFFADELRQVWAAMREGANETPANSWIIPCPTDVETEYGIKLCGQPIKIKDADFAAEVFCRSCKTHWLVGRLLMVGASATAGGIFVDSEAASAYLGVSERTLRAWARQGKIQRVKGRYNIVRVT